MGGSRRVRGVWVVGGEVVVVCVCGVLVVCVGAGVGVCGRWCLGGGWVCGERGVGKVVGSVRCV